MARTATMTLQTIWDCPWSRLAHPPPGVTVEPPEGLWVCVRPQGRVVRRPVTEEDCAACPYWTTELSDDW